MQLLKRINGFFFEDDRFHLEYLFFYIPVIVLVFVTILRMGI